MVSSQEFGCLLDMVYTGKLPVGKHNVSRIVAAADSLQMFDVAVGFKKVLSTLVKQQPPVQVVSVQTLAQTPSPDSKGQSPNPEPSPAADAAPASLDGAEAKTEHSESEREDGEEPGCKRARLEPPETTGEGQNQDKDVAETGNWFSCCSLLFLNVQFCSACSSD